jgi:small subunit ribosomal protein S16
MLSIRFSRVGRKNRAQFRVVLQQHTAAPTGGHVAVLGSYDPHQKVAVLKADKIKEWIAKGAQVSDSAYNLFVKEGIIEGKKRAVKMEKPAAPVVEEVNPPAGGEEVKAEAAPEKAE